MSERDRAKALIDTLPDSKLVYVIAYLQGANIPDETPNAETLEAFKEGDEMLNTGTGQRLSNTDELFEALEA